MWKNVADPGRPQMTLKYGARALSPWITKATNTHLEYVIILAFPLQQWLHECPSMLRYMHFACLVHTQVLN